MNELEKLFASLKNNDEMIKSFDEGSEVLESFNKILYTTATVLKSINDKVEAITGKIEAIDTEDLGKSFDEEISEVNQTMSKSLEEVGDVMEALTDTLKSIDDRVKKIEGQPASPVKSAVDFDTLKSGFEEAVKTNQSMEKSFAEAGVQKVHEILFKSIVEENAFPPAVMTSFEASGKNINSLPDPVKRYVYGKLNS